MPVESRLLRYFAAVAERRSFARAAEQLGIAAPALSRAVRALETELGVTLLHRTTRAVSRPRPGASYWKTSPRLWKPWRRPLAAPAAPQHRRAACY